jgi:hypothetical protein
VRSALVQKGFHTQQSAAAASRFVREDGDALENLSTTHPATKTIWKVQKEQVQVTQCVPIDVAGDGRMCESVRHDCQTKG